MSDAPIPWNHWTIFRQQRVPCKMYWKRKGKNKMDYKDCKSIIHFLKCNMAALPVLSTNLDMQGGRKKGQFVFTPLQWRQCIVSRVGRALSVKFTGVWLCSFDDVTLNALEIWTAKELRAFRQNVADKIGTCQTLLIFRSEEMPK